MTRCAWCASLDRVMATLSAGPGGRHVAGHSLCLVEAREFQRAAIAVSPNARAPGVCDDRLMRPTVLIVDDHAAFRESASALLEAEGFEVAGEAADGAAALAE